MANRKKDNGNGRRLATQQSVDQAVKSICDIMRCCIGDVVSIRSFSCVRESIY